jgi:Mg-chelatase subunit ChlD
VGLVSFNTQATVDVPLTRDVPALFAGLAGLAAAGGTDIGAALAAASDHLATDGRTDALHVIVLLTDGRRDDRLEDPRQVAQAARDRGVRIYTIGLGSDVDRALLREIAAADSRYFEAPSPGQLFPIYEEILRQVVSSLAGNLVIDDKLASQIDLVPGSSAPPGLEEGARLLWGRALFPTGGLTLTYTVQPQATGLLPVNELAFADYNDADGARRRFEFPVPVVEVIAPTPLPTDTVTATPTPSATSTATATVTPQPTETSTATASPTRRPTPVPTPIYLPVALKGACTPGWAYSNVVLVIDTSSSMTGAKLTAAKAAAKVFVAGLRLPLDRAGVVGFDAEPTLARSLSGDPAAVEAAIDGLSIRRGTQVHTALRTAARELISSGRGAPGNRPVIVLLSDGIHDGPASEVLGEAATARALGIRLYAVGLGDDADGTLLQAVADPGGYRFAPSPDELREIYRGLAQRVACR